MKSDAGKRPFDWLDLSIGVSLFAALLGGYQLGWQVLLIIIGVIGFQIGGLFCFLRALRQVIHRSG